MTDYELGWLVGILEGEGCFYAGNFPKNPPRIALMISDYDVIEKVAKLLDDAKIYTHKGKGTNKDMYQIAITKLSLTRKWFAILKPYMSTRRQQKIDECLDTLTYHGPGYT